MYPSFAQATSSFQFREEDDQAGMNAFWTHWSKQYELRDRLRGTSFRNKLIDVADEHMISNDVQPALLFGTIHKNSGEE